ncbi:MAG: rhodanese-like domain-containing protein [Alphaproteobacteria bacterium]|nr:rhodanese-like domain-containing protein [Alphaproteobacteria bacterium]MBL6671615.1 rhodanese-like domain-containing protein [Alphaproteobacteria bacterium]
MPLTHHVSDLVLSARSQIEQTSVQKAFRMQEQGEARLIDIRDVGELKQNGTVTGSYHAPRSMLEFWVDPHSPYHKIVFSTDRKLILFCASGMLSALANKTLMDMGMKNVMDMEGGFTEWRMQQLPIDRPT